MIRGQKNWGAFAIATGLAFVAVTITIVRWHILVRTLELAFSLRDALRVGYLGYAFNLMPLGLVGGDAIKAVALARLHPARKTQAVASVLIDRVIGLVALLFLAGIGTCLLDIDKLGLKTEAARAELLSLCRAIQICALLGGAGMGLLFVPGFTTWSLWNSVARIPLVGGVIRKIMDALHIYRGRADRLLIALVLSLAVHSLYAAMAYFLGGTLLDEVGQPTPRPALADHFTFVPIAMSAGALPIGAFEATLDLLYGVFLPTGSTSAAGKGLLIAILYRVVQILVAGIGMIYFVSTRGKTVMLIKSANEEKELPPNPQD